MPERRKHTFQRTTRLQNNKTDTAIECLGGPYPEAPRKTTEVRTSFDKTKATSRGLMTPSDTHSHMGRNPRVLMSDNMTLRCVVKGVKGNIKMNGAL